MYSIYIHTNLLRNTKSMLFVFLFMSVLSYSQTVTGIVLDNISKQPLIGASVYFDGTTIGVITDETGRFTLTTKKQINTPLIISYIGYNDFLIANPWELGELQVLLNPKAVQLNEVVLSADPFTREEKLQAFKEQFLGNTKGGRSCKIMNEEVISLFFDVSKKELLATADETIIIENPYLGYVIHFRLSDFVASFHRKSLYPIDVKGTYYVGTSFFIDKKENLAKFEKRRTNTFKIGRAHV